MRGLSKIILGLILFLGLNTNGQVSRNYARDKTIEDSREYRQIVKDDGGFIIKDRYEKAYRAACIKNEIWDSIKFAWIGGAGIDTRVNGIYTHATKLYDTSLDEDATQTTESLQPFISGNIAPNERWGLKNVNGGTRYMTHPEVSFAADEPWSVTTVVNNNYNSISTIYFSGVDYRDFIYTSNGTLCFSPASAAGGTTFWNIGFIYGKNLIISIIAYGNGTIEAYINGSSLGINTYATDFTFKYFFRDYANQTTRNFYGTISAHIIRSQALSPTQVAAEAAVLSELFPEIPSVTIDTLIVAASSLEMVANTLGTVITLATTNLDWATGAARWSYHSNDLTVGSVYAKLYNKAARNVIITSPPSGWHVATEAELTALAALGGNALKITGVNYWTTSNGTNSTGFTALGGGSRNADGTFNAVKAAVSFWCADSDKVLKILDDGTATIEASGANEGHYIRLIQD